MGIFNTNDTNNDEMNLDFHFPTTKNALIIFSRNPELGKCKTRLAHTIGDESALKIYKYLLQHTADITKKVIADKFVFYTEHIYKNDVWDDSVFRKKLQEGKHLGIKMKNAFTELFSFGYEKIIIVGSDILDLNTAHISEAFIKLDENDVVMGPALDGGYYLLGMKQLYPQIFENKAWGTETVLKDTLIDFQNFKVELLDELNDIDTFEDIKEIEVFQNFINKSELKK